MNLKKIKGLVIEFHAAINPETVRDFIIEKLEELAESNSTAQAIDLKKRGKTHIVIQPKVGVKELFFDTYPKTGGSPNAPMGFNVPRISITEELGPDISIDFDGGFNLIHGILIPRVVKVLR